MPVTIPSTPTACPCGAVPTLYCAYCQKMYCAECDANVHAPRRMRVHCRYPLPNSTARGNAISRDMCDTAPLDYTEDVFVCATFTVPVSGHYTITNQCSITTNSTTKLDTIQYGICNKNMTDLSKCIDNKFINSIVAKGKTITNLMTPTLFLIPGCEYVAWLNVVSGKNANIEFSNKFSNLTLLNIDAPK